MPKLCQYCKKSPAKLKRAKNGYKTCLPCFYHNFEEEIHHTITTESLFTPGDLIILAISGGKDSTVLVEVLTTLKARHNYPITLQLLAIDEGIKGYRDDSLITVQNNSKHYNLPLTILNYKTQFGRTMDKVVSLTSVRNSCTYCGVFRRKALNQGMVKLKGDRLYTGHNADDIAETVLMNMLRGDAFRLVHCTEAQSGGGDGGIRRCKPFKFTYEKEIVLYAHYKKLEYFSTECTYSKEAFRGPLKELMKDLMGLRTGVIEDVIRDASFFELNGVYQVPVKRSCEVCGCVSSGKICKACTFRRDLGKIEEEKEREIEKEKKEKKDKVELIVEKV